MNMRRVGILPCVALLLSGATLRADADDWQARHPRGHDIVNIGRDSTLPAGETADAVVSIMGSSSVLGDAARAVAVLGDTRVTGSVRENAVAVLGDTVIDGEVRGNAVAVFGDVELGPNANVHGDVVTVGGEVRRDPGAQLHGMVQTVIGRPRGFAWLRPWIEHCLLYGRPLALAPGLAWAWWLALGLLALYAGFARIFRDGVERCLHTLETQPGTSFAAALVAALLAPIVVLLLCITVVGIAAIPLLAGALLLAGLFGKAVVLAWLGYRLVGARAGTARLHPSLAVLIGGTVVTVLYLLPVAGFIVYKVIGLFGLGAVAYTLVLLAAARRAEGARSAAAATMRPEAATAAAPATAQPTAAQPTPPPAATQVPLVDARPRAGFWVRMSALLIDTILVGAALGLLGRHSHAQLLALAIYGAIMWKVRGSTVGGIVFDLKVVRLDGYPIEWETAIVRALACFLSLAAAGLGFFWIAFDQGKQAWHDKIAGTAVVRVRAGAALS